MRKAGTDYSVGRVDPEIGGYNGKTWNDRRDSSDSTAGISAFDLGQRENTRKDYGGGEWTHETKNLGGKDYQVPTFHDEGATGTNIDHHGYGADVPPWMQRGLATGLRTAIGSVIPGAGLAFAAGRQFMPDENPFQNTAFETLMGRKAVEGPVAPDRMPYRVRRQNRNRDNG